MSANSFLIGTVIAYRGRHITNWGSVFNTNWGNPHYYKRGRLHYDKSGQSYNKLENWGIRRGNYCKLVHKSLQFIRSTILAQQNTKRKICISISK